MVSLPRFCPINPAIKVESTLPSPSHYVIPLYLRSLYLLFSTPFDSPLSSLLPPSISILFLTLLLQKVLNSVSLKTASVSDSFPFLNQIHPFLTFPLLALKATWKPSLYAPYRQRLNHAQLQVPFLSLALPAIAQSSAPSPRHAPITWEAEVQGGTPESEDENPVADGPEEADAILAALPLSGLFFYRALPLLGVESSPRIFTEPALCGAPPRPSGASLRYAAPAPDQLRAEPLDGMGDNSRLAPF